MARPSKYCAERETKIVEALVAGNTRKTAARLAGIDQGTLENWMRRYSDFSTAVEKAEADAEAHHVANIKTVADDGTWTASAWWLERRRHQEWGKVDRVEIEVRRAAEQIAANTGADPDWLIKRAQEIAERAQRAEVAG
jgi:transposase